MNFMLFKKTPYMYMVMRVIEQNIQTLYEWVIEM